MSSFESLPVELIADILGELDIATLVTVSHLSHRLRTIASDSSLNPWRRPILRNLYQLDGEYEQQMKHLSVRPTVPRQNWVEILTLGKAEYLLFEMTLPNLAEQDWEECFKRRFLPGWVKWKTTTWKAAFLKLLHRVWHRCHSSCTADESWTKYIQLNRNGSANLLEGSSRGFSPMTIFQEIKLQNNLAHFPTDVRLVVEFRDVRIIVLGVLNKPRSLISVNQNARNLLHPPGITKGEDEAHSATRPRSISEGSDESFVALAPEQTLPDKTIPPINVKDTYRPLTHPLPSTCHANYPLYTPGGEDKRWFGNEEEEEHGRQWLGPMLITAQLIGPQTKQYFDPEEGGQDPTRGLDLVVGPGRSSYASLTWADLTAIAPWLDITKQITGPGLGH